MASTRSFDKSLHPTCQNENAAKAQQPALPSLWSVQTNIYHFPYITFKLILLLQSDLPIIGLIILSYRSLNLH